MRRQTTLSQEAYQPLAQIATTALPRDYFAELYVAGLFADARDSQRNP
jgi:hypothetical protein